MCNVRVGGGGARPTGRYIDPGTWATMIALMSGTLPHSLAFCAGMLLMYGFLCRLLALLCLYENRYGFAKNFREKLNACRASLETLMELTHH